MRSITLISAGLHKARILLIGTDREGTPDHFRILSTDADIVGYVWATVITTGKSPFWHPMQVDEEMPKQQNVTMIVLLPDVSSTKTSLPNYMPPGR